MTTYSFQTLIVDTSDDDDDARFGAGILEIVTASFDIDFRYDLLPDEGDEYPRMELQNPESFVLRLDGDTLDDDWVFEIGQVDWDGQTTILLFLIDEDEDVSHAVALAGAALPAIFDEEDFELWVDSISYSGPIFLGDYAPGMPIDLGAAPGVSVDEDDLIGGGTGDDTIAAGGGSDTLNGGSGDDSVYGGDGGDVIFGGNGDDTLQGGNGGDDIDGQGGRDVIFGGTGFDLLEGGTGRDRIFGASGADTIFGGSGNDRLFGNAGDDIIDGGAGRDNIRGGTGADTFVFELGDGRDVIFDFEVGIDRLKFDLGELGDGFLRAETVGGSTVLFYGPPVSEGSVTLLGVIVAVADLDISFG